MLFALGAGGRVVGVTNFCHYPKQARALPKIGSYTQPNLETILALRPDLVVIQKNPIRLGERLAALKLNVLELDYDNVAGIYGSISRLGEAIGAGDDARTLAASIRTRLDGVRASVAAFPRRRVLFVVGRTPGTMEGLMAAGGRSYLSEIIELAGGDNVFAGSSIPYPRIGLEEVIARKPEVVIDMGDMAQTEGVTEARKRAVAVLWSRYQVLPAVRAGRVFPVASDELVVPGPRVVEAARMIARMIHPEARF